MGADLRAGQGQMGRRRDEPPELGPAGVSGGITAFAGPAEAAAVAGRGELHAAARTTAAAISTTRNGCLPLLRLQNLGIHAPPA